jgi:glycosyltransferase involved in cell wall biosynthesis
VARLQPEKGVEVFLDAVASLSSRFPRVHFCIVGDGPLRGDLTGRVRELSVVDRVRFLGRRADARALLPSFTLLAVPSLSEGEPLIVLEAMGAGVPVVATQVGGIPRQIRHERDGLLVPPGDPMALGDAILRLLRDPAEAGQLAHTARQRVRTEFPFEMMLEEIERCYDRALTPGGKPALVSSRLAGVRG